MNREILLSGGGINKSFGPTKALDAVDFSIRRGEIHGLIGENGSGKSTLSSIFAGVQKADSGELEFKSAAYQPENVLMANDMGICMLLQEQGTFDEISAAANIFVGKEAQFVKHGLMDTKMLFSKAKEVLNRIGVEHINERAKTINLSFEDRKLLEIARAVSNNPEILIVDETTTALSRNGRELLYGIMKQMKDDGKSVIFISHDIAEVKENCDYLTVLRDGKLIATLEKQEFSDDTIRRLMVGREVAENFYRADQQATKQDGVALSMKHVTYGLLKDISIDVHWGEIVGLGGLTDCGMHDVGKLMFGLLRAESGSVRHGNGTLIRNTIAATKNKIGYVAKDRDKEALMTAASIKDNICGPSLRKLQKCGLITSRTENDFVDTWAKALSIKASGINQYVMYLSGGNKQKVSVAKWMGFDADIFIFDCPTRGIDIGVKSAIYQLMMELKARGKAIVMISEELMEIIGMSDRTIIIKDGTITGEFVRDDKLTEEQLIQYII
ncbi:MAG: sugar ABC transporter ATP-binding protein [Lachnospiraceae bacterium]